MDTNLIFGHYLIFSAGCLAKAQKIMDSPDKKTRHKRQKKCYAKVQDETTELQRDLQDSMACASSSDIMGSVVVNDRAAANHTQRMEDDTPLHEDDDTRKSDLKRKNRSKETMSKEKFIAKLKKAKPLWKNRYGAFTKIQTSSTGNCFFSALSLGGLFDSEGEARREVVRLIKEDEHLFFRIYDWHKGRANLDEFRTHLCKLQMDRTWASDVDIFMSAVALKVDIISINEFDSSICRPLVDKHMFRHVPALGTELKNCENVRTVVLGNVNISGNAERPNHFILLGVVESRIEPYDKHCTYTENVRIGEQVKAVVDMVGEQPIDIYCERESAIDVDAIDATGHIFLQTDDKCDVSIVKQDGTGLDVRIGNEGTFSLVRSRSVQQVVTNAQRLTVAKWMIEKENEGVENIPTKAVEEFPRFFR